PRPHRLRGGAGWSLRRRIGLPPETSRMGDASIALNADGSLADPLRAEGLDVHPFVSVLDLRDGEPDVVVVDGRLPGGPSLLRRLKAEPETTSLPVVDLDPDGAEWEYWAEAGLPA